MILKQTFVKYSSNILETLLCDYWNLPKDQHLLLLNHTMFPECPEHCNAEGTLSEYSCNVACRLGSLFIQEHLFFAQLV